MKLYRTAAGYSQEKLADLCASYQVRISRIERHCGPTPTEDEAQRIADALGVSPETLFGGNGAGK